MIENYLIPSGRFLATGLSALILYLLTFYGTVILEMRFIPEDWVESNFFAFAFFVLVSSLFAGSSYIASRLPWAVCERWACFFGFFGMWALYLLHSASAEDEMRTPVYLGLLSGSFLTFWFGALGEQHRDGRALSKARRICRPVSCTKHSLYKSVINRL